MLAYKKKQIQKTRSVKKKMFCFTDICQSKSMEFFIFTFMHLVDGFSHITLEINFISVCIP